MVLPCRLLSLRLSRKSSLLCNRAPQKGSVAGCERWIAGPGGGHNLPPLLNRDPDIQLLDLAKDKA